MNKPTLTVVPKDITKRVGKMRDFSKTRMQDKPDWKGWKHYFEQNQLENA